MYSVYHRFMQAKIAYGGSILSSSQFLLLSSGPLKLTLTIKVVKIDSKTVILLPWSKSMKQSLEMIEWKIRKQLKMGEFQRCRPSIVDVLIWQNSLLLSRDMNFCVKKINILTPVSSALKRTCQSKRIVNP